jgi:hypothetical protein
MQRNFEWQIAELIVIPPVGTIPAGGPQLSEVNVTAECLTRAARYGGGPHCRDAAGQRSHGLEGEK